MNARRLILAALAPMCALVCWLVMGVIPAIAAPTQFAPGQFAKPVGVAVDQATSEVYVADAWAGQTDVFEGSGGLLSSFGKALLGLEPGPKGVAGPAGVAVDNELSSLSYGDVYVVDWDNHRVDKFDSSGKFLLMFGGDVNETTGGNVCVAGEACKTGTEGTADAHFEWVFRKSFIAVGPGGAIYVGDRARVQVFEPSGVWREDISLAGLSSTGKVSALAVDSSGDMFVKIGNRENEEGAVPGVREFEPNGTEKSVQFDVGSDSVEALALDGSGNVFVADSNGSGTILEYDSAGNKLAKFGANTAEFALGMAYASASDQLYVSSGYPSKTESVWVLPVPVHGPPTIEESGVSAIPGSRGHASLEAKFNPGGFETTSHFEYVSDADFQASGYADASSTPDVVVGASLEEQSANAALTGLITGGIYHYRLVATNSKGTAPSPDQTFAELPPALIKGPWGTNVAATSATLDAEINPLGASTEYQLEYGATITYGQTVSGDVGGGEEYVPISLHRQELLPGTTYHYRVVVTNEFGTVEGADHTFTTQTVGSEELTLPDGRAWELVSPANKKGALIEPFYANGDEIQAASDGSGITYLTAGPHVGEDPQGKITFSQVLSLRGSDGWRSDDLTLPARLSENGEPALVFGVVKPEYKLFSSDLSLAAVEPQPDATPPLSPEATERTLYLRNDGNKSFLPLVTAGNVPPETKFGGSSSVGEIGSAEQMHFVAATPDLSHVVFDSPFALTPNAIPEGSGGQWNLYEWSGGQLRLVNILPQVDGGEPTQGDPNAMVRLAGGNAIEGTPSGTIPSAVSNDGRRIAWDWGDPRPPTGSQANKFRGLYVRDMVEERTVQVGGPRAVFQAMSGDGSRIFFVENGNLYMFDYDTGTQADLTANHGSGESNGGVKEAVSDVSEDGSYVYFVAGSILANGAVSGEDNLYVSHDTASGWSTTFIGTLSREDEKDWNATGNEGIVNLSGVSSRVSPDGHYLTFMSNQPLTGYDNVDAYSGQPDEEVYLYDANVGRLVCASCDPTGARPVGVFDHLSSGALESLLVDPGESWTTNYNGVSDHWLAGSIPGWDPDGTYGTNYQPRYLSDSGRLFFNSPDALVPQDTNGFEDVYEYEPVGVGGAKGCTEAAPTFNGRSSGCVNLISSGTSSGESAFFDASEDGDDVFFVTASRLATADYDAGYDVYDAHVCSSGAPCAVSPVSPPSCSSGDSCKAAPAPQPEVFGPAPSATFSGTGNVVEEAKRGVAKRKPKPKVKPKKRKIKPKKHRAARKAGKSPAGKSNRKVER